MPSCEYASACAVVARALLIEPVLQQAIGWYRPLRFRRVDEDGARQAVLQRRPVLSTFYLSGPGWEAFGRHFSNNDTRTAVLSYATMEPREAR
jgi:hypothetical protein